MKQPRKMVAPPPVEKGKNRLEITKKSETRKERGKENEKKRVQKNVTGSASEIVTKKGTENERKTESEKRIGSIVKAIVIERIMTGAVAAHGIIGTMGRMTARQETMEESGIEMIGTGRVTGHPNTEKTIGDEKVAGRARELISTEEIGTTRRREKGRGARLCTRMMSSPLLAMRREPKRCGNKASLFTYVC